mgnify:CR=1 FL=1
MSADIFPAGPAYFLRVLVSAKIAWLRLRDFCSFVVKLFLSIFFLKIFCFFVAYVTDKPFHIML